MLDGRAVLIDTQIWWAAFAMREVRYWNFSAFLFYLLMPIIAFLLSYLALPELGDEDDIYFAADFSGNGPGSSACWPHYPRSAWSTNTSTQPVALSAVALIAACVHNARFHFWNALFALALVCGYFATVFLLLH